MEGRSRYNISAKGAGIDSGVLKNKLGIKNQKALEDAETLLLSDAYVHFFKKLEKENTHFDLLFLYQINKYFLGPLYTWAGKTRQVNISKDDVLFAPAEFLETSLKEFENVLKRNLPTLKDSKKMIAQKLSIVHNELNVLHPFREGNGRTIRLFLDLIASRAGYETIDWSKTTREQYIDACRLGMREAHSMMERIIYRGLSKRLGKGEI